MIQSLLSESLHIVVEECQKRAEAPAKKRQEKRAREEEICQGYKYIRRLDKEAEVSASVEFFGQFDEVATEEEDGQDFVEEVLGLRVTKEDRNRTPIPLTALECSRSQVK